MEKIKCETVDFAAENAAKLIKLFPECEGERGMVDLEKLRQVLSSSVVDGDVERYQFIWPGKRKAMAAANAATTKTLRPAIPESVGRDGTAGKFDSENLYIEGDNLEALKLLQCNYAGKVKMIYIDPPYNTGHDFVYRDRFSLTDKELAQEGGAFDEDGNRFEKNDSAEARYHSNWCSMMYPRLKLARNLLRDDGVLFMSIDDNEVVNARKLCDEVFGEKNILGMIILKTATDNNGSQVTTEHEYMLCVAKHADAQSDWKRRSESAARIIEQFSKLKAKGFSNENIQMALRKWIRDNKNDLPQVAHYNNVDDKGVYSSSGNSSNPHPGGYMFDVIHPKTKKPCPKPANGWRWPEKTFLAYEEAGEVEWGDDDTTQPHIKKRIDTAMESLRSLIYEDNRGTTKELSNLFDGKKVFDNPKPHHVLSRMMDFVTSKDSLILDFFSGSATTAHAVMQLNAEDGGNRKFILVQLPEVCAEDSEAAKAGYKNICEIGKERIRRAGKKIREEIIQHRDSETQRGEVDLFSQDSLSLCDSALKKSPTVDIGFRVLKIDSSSLDDVSATVGETNQMMFDKLERIKSDRTPEDILFQLLIETHIPLSDPIAKVKVGGNEVFFVGVEEDGFRQDLQDSQDLGSGDNPVNPVNHVQKIYENAPLVACLDRSAKLTNEFFLELAAFKPGIAFFRDDAFNDDAARINVEQIFKQNSPNTIVKVI